MSGDVAQRTVTVTGTASADVRPDRASLSLGVQSRRPSAQSAMAGSSTSGPTTLVSALRDAGARDDDLRTTRPQPVVRPVRAGQYVASYSITVSAARRRRRPVPRRRRRGRRRRVHAQRRVVLRVADPAAVVAPLRELAVADARAKAEVLAAAAGCTVGRSSRSSRAAAAAPSRSSSGATRAMAASDRGRHRDRCRCT